MEITEKVAYLKGLAEGMELDTEKKEGKLLSAIIDVLEDIALELEDIHDETSELADGLDAVSDDLEDVEDVVFGEEDEDEDDFEDDFDVSPRPVDRRDRDRSDRMDRTARTDTLYGSPSDESDRRSNKVVNIRAATQLQVVLVKPEKFEDASAIADHLREKRTVVLNLESTNKEIARRLLDFLSGVAYANEGKIKKVAISTYIITPYNVDILGDLIDELENNGLYF